MLGRTVELVGGPMCGERIKAKYRAVGQVVFLRGPEEQGRPLVHVYEADEGTRDFTYRGIRPYQRGDAGRIVGRTL